MGIIINQHTIFNIILLMIRACILKRKQDSSQQHGSALMLKDNLQETSYPEVN